MIGLPESFSKALSPIVLPDTSEASVRLGSLWAKRPAVIVFLRHYGWIFCREHVAQLRERQSEFEAKGANLAAIGLGDRMYAQAFREETGISFPLLIDEERLAYKAAGLQQANLFHLLRSDNARARTKARAAGHSQHRLGQNVFQLGGSFVFGPRNTDLFAHVSATFGDNANLDDLLGALE